LFLSTVVFAHLKPFSISSPFLDLMVAILYSVVPPTLNPVIYGMRNKEIKHALNQMLQHAISQLQECARLPHIVPCERSLYFMYV